MRVLLSTIGSRGDVQPLVGLAVQLRTLGHDARICAPPDFRGWVEGFGFEFVPIGPPVRATARPGGPTARPTPDEIRQMMEGTVVTQFQTIPVAAVGCDAILAGNALNIAARSIAELMGIPYMFATYYPIALPSAHHAPPRVLAWTPDDPDADNLTLWAEDTARWNERWGPALNAQRAVRGLPPVSDVRTHVTTETPWIAADTTLAPWPEAGDTTVVQTGAWILEDRDPLPPDVEAFLAAGDPPVYFGFGSIRGHEHLNRTMIESARAVGRRAIVSRGWADLALIDEAPDCLSIGDVNVLALFPRVAAVVHHGGAGTTTAAAASGTPQVVIPQHYDQPYFAARVQPLGIGVAHAAGAPSPESLTLALSHALDPAIGVQARARDSARRSPPGR